MVLTNNIEIEIFVILSGFIKITESRLGTLGSFKTMGKAFIGLNIALLIRQCLSEALCHCTKCTTSLLLLLLLTSEHTLVQ